MENAGTFEQLLTLLTQVKDEEVETAIAIARCLQGGKEVHAYPPHLVGLVERLTDENRPWFEMVLCVRSQQSGRERSWQRFASSSYWDLTTSYAPRPAGIGMSGIYSLTTD